jgi:hypothetical protein
MEGDNAVHEFRVMPALTRNIPRIGEFLTAIFSTPAASASKHRPRSALARDPNTCVAEDEEPEFRAAVNEFEAAITDAVAISAFDGHVPLAPGTYLVTILHDEGGTDCTSDSSQAIESSSAAII